MKLRRLAPVVVFGVIFALWGGAFLKWGRVAPTEAQVERPGGSKEVEEKLEDLRASVLGKEEKLRGSDVHAPQIRPPKSVYNYTPREVCLQMKVTHPDKFNNVDCSSSKFDSPSGWIWEPKQ